MRPMPVLTYDECRFLELMAKYGWINRPSTRYGKKGEAALARAKCVQLGTHYLHLTPFGKAVAARMVK